MKRDIDETAGGEGVRPGAGAEGALAAGEPVLEVEGLRVSFSSGRGWFGRGGMERVVDGVTFRLGRGQTLGLVGESGSGKSTVCRAVLRLVEPEGGRVRLRGRDFLSLRGGALRRARREMQMVFQDPAGSLNPRMRVAEIVSEPLLVHGVYETTEAARGVGGWRRRRARRQWLREQAVTLLSTCGMPAEAAERYPHQFSGGQRQRIAIARALALRPAVVLCDEPTSALDVSIQAQILNLLRDLQREFAVSYVFVSHDMAVIEHMSDEVAVMYRGKVVEQGPAANVLGEPRHEYTKGLLAAVPRMPEHVWRP
ncbi:MAG: ABC transporter ATP-binding protein [Phycisphaeraceae bacterium]|nr:ABC transporter ATP-binding protein [Phycisphaeraceae bacterium]